MVKAEVKVQAKVERVKSMEQRDRRIKNL